MYREEFKRQLQELRQVISDCVAYFSAWRGLMVEDEESARALNRYRGLFLVSRDALQKMLLLQLAKVFDPDPRTTGIRKLLSAARENRENLIPHVTEEDLRDVEHRVDASEDLLNRLKRYRDQRLAHHDAIDEDMRLSDDMRVRFGEVRDLIEEVKSIYNLLEEGHTSFEHLTSLAKFHADEVVRIMREDRDRAIRTIEEADTAQ
jgi:hypothetical protein